MQTTRKQPALRALDGGRAGTDVVALVPVQNADPSVSGDVAAALEALVRSTRANLRFRCASGEPSAETGTQGNPARVSFFAAAGPEPAAPAHVTRYRSFDPIVGSRLPSLDLAVVSTDASASDNVFDKRASFVDASCVELACRYAKRFGRRRVSLLLAPDTDGEERRAIDQLRASTAERHPELDVSTATVTAVTAALVGGSATFDVVVTIPAFSAVLGEIASGLCGAGGLATRLRFTEAGVTSSGLLPRDEHASPGMVAPLLSAAELFGWLGEGDAALDIVNGCLRTLEFGLHTDEVCLASPVAREIDAAEFAAAVRERLGERPRILVPRHTGIEQRARRADRRPALSVVTD